MIYCKIFSRHGNLSDPSLLEQAEVAIEQYFNETDGFTPTILGVSQSVLTEGTELVLLTTVLYKDEPK